MDYRVTYSRKDAQGAFWLKNCPSLKNAQETVARIKKAFKKEFGVAYIWKIEAHK